MRTPWLSVDRSVRGRHVCNGRGISVNHVARWNGSGWAALGTGMNGDTYSLAQVIVFSMREVLSPRRGATANHIARWNGSSWSALGSEPEPMCVRSR